MTEVHDRGEVLSKVSDGSNTSEDQYAYLTLKSTQHTSLSSRLGQVQLISSCGVSGDDQIVLNDDRPTFKCPPRLNIKTPKSFGIEV